MSNLFDILSQKINNVSIQFAKNGKKYLKSILSHGEIIGHKGKVQIEIEKLKWELKQKYNELGKHVAEKKISNSVTDFSHDSQFLELVNNINKIKLYIDERLQKRDSNLVNRI